jgi:hypothetical protein
VEKGKENWSAFDTAMTILENGGNEVEQVAMKTKLSSRPPGQTSIGPFNDSFIEVFRWIAKHLGVPKSASTIRGSKVVTLESVAGS